MYVCIFRITSITSELFKYGPCFDSHEKNLVLFELFATSNDLDTTEHE